ncbi:hypothetical protein P7C70_g8228, partial [Phenoliferia sp. Uapishka_3]
LLISNTQPYIPVRPHYLCFLEGPFPPTWTETVPNLFPTECAETGASGATDADAHQVSALDLLPPHKILTLEPAAGFGVEAQLAEAGAPVLLSATEALACTKSKPSRDAAMVFKRLLKGHAYKAGFPVVTRIVLNNTVVMATVDSGAGPSVIGAKMLAKIDPDYAKKLMPLKGLARQFQAFGHALDPAGIYETQIIFPHPSGNVRLNIELVVMVGSNNPNWVLIGCDWLLPYRFNLMFGHSPSFTIGSLKQRWAVAPRAKQPVLLDDISTAAQAAASAKSPVETLGVRLVKLHALGCTAPSGALQFHRRNTSTAPTSAQTAPLTSEVAALSAEGASTTPDPEAFEAAFKTMKINPELTAEQKHELESVIRRHPMAFAHGLHQLGQITSHECRVKFTDDARNAKLCSGAFPRSPRARAAMRESLDEFLRLGIIQPSKSKYAAPAFIVFQDDKPRMVVNSKALNAVTVSDAYPLPRIDATLYSIKDCEYLTSLDANKGFYQLWVYAQHRERLTIITEFGLFEFLRMPMGLKNSPATFQRAMNTHFDGPIRAGWLTIYIDDLLLKAKSWPEHIRSLELTFRTLELNGWTLNPKKCYFGYKSVRQVGHRLSGLLLGIDENKVDLAPPRKVKQLHSWFGFVGYFRKFLRDYGKIARPLTRLLGQGIKWEWTEACQQAHNEIEKLLLTAPMLAQPDYSKPFRQYVDASGGRLRAVLQQEQVSPTGEKSEKVVRFISCQLRGAENKYGATQLECLGLVWALDKLHVFLDGSTFEMAIQEYRGRMTIRHRKGITHINADGMSRMSLPNVESNPASDLQDEEIGTVHALSFVEFKNEFFDAIKESYQKDNAIRRIYTVLTQPDVDPTAMLSGLDSKLRSQFDAGRFFLLDELLYRRKGAAVALVVCDVKTCASIISACHDQVTAGHFGLEKTYARVKALAWWPGVYTDTEDYVSRDACQRASKHTGKPYGFAQRIEEPKKPWELINMDFVSGFPPGGKEGFNAVLVIVDCFSRRARFLPTFTDADAKFTASQFFASIMNEHGVPVGIVSDRDKLFTSDFWKYLSALCGIQLKLSTSYHPQTDGLAERYVQILEGMLQQFVAFGPTWTDNLGFTHDWIELLPGLEFAVNSSVHSGLPKTPFGAKRGYIPRSIYSLITDKLPKIQTDPSTESYARMVQSAHQRALECISESVTQAQARSDAHHAEPPFAVGDTVMLLTNHFNFGKGPTKLIPPYVGPFGILKMIGPNAIKLKLTAPYDRKHPVFPVSFAKLHITGDPEISRKASRASPAARHLRWPAGLGSQSYCQRTPTTGTRWQEKALCGPVPCQIQRIRRILLGLENGSRTPQRQGGFASLQSFKTAGPHCGSPSSKPPPDSISLPFPSTAIDNTSKHAISAFGQEERQREI